MSHNSGVETSAWDCFCLTLWKITHQEQVQIKNVSRDDPIIIGNCLLFLNNF